MGASSSKAARSAASSSARRKYPSRTPESNPTTNTSSAPPPPAGQPTAPGPTVHPQSQASGSRDESKNTPIAINLDASDPHFAKSLRSLGPVKPSSTLSNSSTFSPTSPSHPSSSPTSSVQDSSNSQTQPQIFPNHLLNPALQILSRRSELAEEAEAEFTRLRGGGEGRRFLDVVKIREILALRDGKGMGEAEIERRLGLRRGVVGQLGGRGVVSEAGLGVGKDAGPL
ncbi:MAG: hypothetical protein Q9192_000818 [Flavoplaca navasiana]